MELKKIFKIRAKIVLKINFSVKKPGHQRIEVARSGLWAPRQNEYFRFPGALESRSRASKVPTKYIFKSFHFCRDYTVVA